MKIQSNNINRFTQDMPIKSYSLCEWNKEMSDHVAQIIEV